jgi:hypothetical protein
VFVKRNVRLLIWVGFGCVCWKCIGSYLFEICVDGRGTGGVRGIADENLKSPFFFYLTYCSSSRL